MAQNIDDFWKIFSSIQGNDTDLTKPIKALAKNEQAVVEEFLNVVVDQISHNSSDWSRIKNFLRDWCASHRTIASFQNKVNDVYGLPNDQLDELFRSFGYSYSTLIKDSISNEPPESKINFFLDLVNLYKRKGTPQTLLDVFKYYGVADLDIYEFQLQLEERASKNPNDLIFKGKITVGTSGDSSPLYLPFDFLTESDPHWFQTESQIRTLLTNNKINLPSTTPYFAVKPVFDEEAIDTATGMLSRKVQDQYDLWEYNGKPDESVVAVLSQDASITITGEITSMLTLYLSTIYIFNKEFHVGSPASRFICYDGTNSLSVDILDEFQEMTEQKIFTREQWNTQWELYVETFSRVISSNFLQTSTDAGIILDQLNPGVKSGLDNLTTDNIEILGTLLNDLGEWVRNNINFGFINMSYILFGIDSFFAQMSDVVDFFKPYRARLVALEQLQFRNRLFNTIIVEDSISAFDVEQQTHDFMTGDSNPCCTNQGIDSTDQTTICLDSTADLYYSRDTYDCGSFHDIGAVTDIPENEFIEVHDNIPDRLSCPTYYGDGTAAIYNASNLDAPNAPIVTSNLSDYDLRDYDIYQINAGDNIAGGSFKELQTPGYALTLNLFNTVDSTAVFYSHIIIDKTNVGYTAKISGTPTTSNYYMAADYDNSDNSGIAHIPDGTNVVVVSIPSPPEIIDETSYTVAVSISNTVDTDPTCYHYTVVERTSTYFKVLFSDNIDSNNYYLEWIVISHEKQDVTSLSLGIDSITIPLSPTEVTDNYGLSLELLNEVDSTSVIIPFIVTDKNINQFTVSFEQPINSLNYQLMWSRPLNSSEDINSYNYYQTSGFMNFDGVPLNDSTGVVYVEGTQGTFDCIHNQEIVDIEIQDIQDYLVQEDSGRLLLEDGFEILL